MLINTVVLFLRDTLPIFLLISVLLALPSVSRWSLIWRVAVLAVISFVLYLQLGPISQLAEGAGFELLKSALFFVAWLGMCMIALPVLTTHRRFNIGVSLLMLGICLPNSLHFLVYFVSQLARSSDSSLLLLGTTIGLGICISIAILLNIVLTNFVSVRVMYFIMPLFVAAQVANIALLLEQTDVFPAPHLLWDSSNIISDNSEYGHLFNALFGYEATPSLSYLCVFCFALIVPIALRLLATVRVHPNRSQEVA
ncbi:hypothetical protein KUL42_24170 [Alteromonas sp. KUL42]|uniref:FTR1 family iron permease n=1 Tax=Alteromonas sp. KUL42 TaxID=2480797 RepID=UPI001035AB91|nr:FTR1 family iron permease [Alteromonas sp. KUL42]TAP34889.1 FTR1 family iron permease [Alteromonas sp. KUL42]GEA07656.1 hypothetical protein KUL42_24170 [Alteromonas sp. KUL42]